MQLTLLQQWCLADQDNWLCFRELATGCWHMTQPQGAAHPEMFELPSAIASIFIHCGITFSCPFSHEQATYYTAFTAWQQQLTACQANTTSSDPEYICSKTAYGTPIASCPTTHQGVSSVTMTRPSSAPAPIFWTSPMSQMAC